MKKYLSAFSAILCLDYFKNESDFMLRTFLKPPYAKASSGRQSRHNITPKAYKSHTLVTLLTLLMLLVPSAQCRAYEHDFVFVNKSYNKDLLLSIRLYKSFEQFVQPKNIPFYIVVPNKELSLFRSTFSQAKADKIIESLPIFLSDEVVFKKCGPHVLQKAIRMSGWKSQQVVKMCFGKLDIAKNYMTIDSDIYFTKIFPVEILFKNGMIKTYYPKPQKEADAKYLKEPFIKIKEVLEDKSSNYANFILGNGTWSSDILKALQIFIQQKNFEDFADLIKLAPYEMQWYTTFISAHHKNLLYPLSPLFSFTWSPEKAKRECMPTEGYPWSYGLDTSSSNTDALYINPCSKLKSFIKRIRKLKKYISFYLYGNAFML